MTIPETFFLHIPSEDEVVAFQRYLNLCYHITNSTDGYNRIVLDGIQYGVYSRMDIVQLSRYNLETDECIIWEWDAPMSWYQKHAGSYKAELIDNKQFIEEFFEFIADYKDSE